MPLTSLCGVFFLKKICYDKNGNRRICGRLWLPAAESSIHASGVSAVKASGRVVHETSKNEDTWCKKLAHLKCRIIFNPERIRWVVARKAFYTFRNPNGNRYVFYLYRNDDGAWNWNYNWLDNDWNDRHLSAGRATLFFSPPKIFLGGVLLTIAICFVNMLLTKR